jgi:hypothetical protein
LFVVIDNLELAAQVEGWNAGATVADKLLGPEVQRLVGEHLPWCGQQGR